jgi:hypothetical protein
VTKARRRGTFAPLGNARWPGQAGGATDETSDFGQGVNKATAEFRRRNFLGLIGRLAFGMGTLVSRMASFWAAS